MYSKSREQQNNDQLTRRKQATTLSQEKKDTNGQQRPSMIKEKTRQESKAGRQSTPKAKDGTILHNFLLDTYYDLNINSYASPLNKI